MTWLVILVWVFAVAFSAFWLARVGLDLAKKSRRLLDAAAPLVANVNELAAVASAVTSYEPKPDNLQDSPVEHLNDVLEQRKARERRAVARQRRLIDRLKP